MVHQILLTNGRRVGLSICEITAVPHYELLHRDLDRACQLNQVLFNQILTGFYRRSALNNAAIEILWQSAPVENQTYAAQVRQFILLRMLGDSAEAIDAALAEQQAHLSNELRGKNFELEEFETEEQYQDLLRSLQTTSTNAVAALAKRERYIQNMLMPNSCLYYNDVLQPSSGLNVADLTNALTRYPNCAVSLQLIPTGYVEDEMRGIEQGRTYMSYYISDMRFRQGIQADANTQAVANCYEYLLASEKEPLFYYNFLVYGDAGNVMSLANKLIDVIEEEGSVSGSALEIVDLTGCGLSPATQIEVQPWTISNLLIFKMRNMQFWGAAVAPKHMLRLRYLATAREVGGAFKLPVDDGFTIGLESKKISTNREKLNQSIISEGNFKVGRIITQK